MGTLISLIIARTGLGTAAARIVAYAALALLAVAALGSARCAYDKAVIAKHDANQDAATARADRKADARSAEQRRSDDARLTTETQQIEEAVNEASPDPASRRAAYYECVRAIQAARRNGVKPAGC